MTNKPSVNDTIQRNIESVHRHRKSADDVRKLDHVMIDRLAYFAGSLRSLYLHLILYGGWIVLAEFFEPSRDQASSLNKLGLVGTLEAIFLAILVLINQRRMNTVERKNSDLHLQFSMLAEHEITRLAELTDLIARQVGVHAGAIKDFSEVKKDIHPEAILERISEHEASLPTDSTGSQ